MNINPHLNFNGQCKEAFEFYEKVLGGKITFSMTWGEMPGGAADQFPPETHQLIMHTTLTVDNQLIMGADSPPDRYTPPKGITVFDQREGQERRRTDLQRIVRRRQRNDAIRADFLVTRFRNVRRSIWNSLDG